MNIDPRTLKELIKLQMLNKMNQITGGSTAGGEDDSEFSDLLNSILSETAEDPSLAGGLPSIGGGNPPLKPAVVSPFSVPANGAVHAPAAHRSAANGTDKLGGKSAEPELDPLIMDASRRHGVQPSLVKAVIDAESSFNTHAVSSAGAKGLMQLMDSTGQGLGVTDPFDPAQNIQGGTRYLSNLLQKYNGNEATALAAYNAGSGRLARLGITNDQELASKLHLLPKETQNYVGKVQRLQHQYQA